MAFGTITSTENSFGSVDGTATGVVAGTLSGSVGVPGPAGAGVPAGGTAGQYLQKIDGTNYNTDWVTLNLSGYAPLASPAFTGNPTGPTAALGDNDTSLATTAFVQQELLSGTANAKNLEVYVRNQTGTTLAAGAIVYINGATGNRPTVTLAQANNDANSAQTMGFVKTAIANNGLGYVIVRGECENLDTSAVAEGTQLYLSPTVAGTYTTTKPSAPDHLVYVGIVIRSHPTQGVILVAVQNGYELNELHDVAITSPTNGQVLKYNSTTGLWYNGTDSAGVAWGGITGTLSSQTDLQTALDGKYSTTNPAGYITSSALSPYLTAATAASTYAPLAGATFTGIVAFNGATGSISTKTPGWYKSYASGAENTDFTLQYESGFQVNAGGTAVARIASSGILAPSAGITFSDATTQTTAGISAATAASTYQTLSGMSSYLTTSAAASTYYPLTGNPSSFLVAADITGKANLSGATFTGLVGTVASTTTTAGLRVPHGTAPTTPVNGDIWTTTAAIFVRINGSSNWLVDGTTTQDIGASKTFSNANVSFGTSAGTGTVNVGTGATISGSTKTVNIGTNGVAGSTTNITIGSTNGTSTTTLQGTTNGVTQPAGDSSLKLATTAFVTAAVPAIATVAQVYASTSGTTATPPLLAPLAFNSGGYFPRMNFASSSSGTGAGVGGADHRFEIIGPNVATAGFAQITSEHQQLWSAGTTFTILQFSKPVWFSFRMCNFSATYDGDAQTEIKAFIGNAVTGGVDPSAPAIGIYKAGGAGSFINLMVHNGTTLTKVATTTTFNTTVIDVAIYSNNGTVNLYLNGVLAATTALGPTGNSNTTRVIAAVKATATAAVRQLLEIANIKVFAPQ